MRRLDGLPRWLVAGAVSLVVVGGLLELLPPLLREIVIALLKACAIAVAAYAAFVALLIRR